MPPKKNKSTDSQLPAESKGRKKVKTEVDYTLNEDIAAWLRIDSVEAVHVTKSGHPTSSSSIADIFSILFFHPSGLKFHSNNPNHFLNDRIILSKGHAAPILYASFYRSGIITQQQLMSLRLKDSIIEGHPTPKIPFVDVATGSLGQGLSVAAGIAYSSKYFDKINNYIYCICGDGEVAEGSIWQAANFSSHYDLNNLIAIIDVNRLGQSQQTMFGNHADEYDHRFKSFGWNTYVINGHSMDEIVKALDSSKNNKKGPSVIIANTFKGKDFGPTIQNKLDWHGKDLGTSTQEVVNHLKSKIRTENIQFKTYAPEGDQPHIQIGKATINTLYPPETKISTRKAYGNALLKAHQSNHNVIGLDGDTKNSTFSITLFNKHPESFIECFIAEQNMIGVSIGLSCRKKIPFCSTFATFFSRGADQIRIAGISNSNIKMVGSHSGCSIGEDGPSQMALQDLAFFRTIPKALVLVPSDGYSAQKCVEIAANFKGPVFIRTSRPEVSLLYDEKTQFQPGKLHILRESENDALTIISYGVTVHESIKAYNKLKVENIHVKVIDLFSLKPLDSEGLKVATQKSHGKVIVVEEHYPEGGAGDAVCSTLVGHIKQYDHLCVRKVPGSAKPEQQLQIHGIDSQSIIKSVKKMLKDSLKNN